MTSRDSPSTSSQLLPFAEKAEDAAAGCYTFRDSIPRAATRITAVIGELFAVSSCLRAIHNAQGTRQGGRSFHRIRHDLRLVFRTLSLTLEQLNLMFGRSRNRPHQTAWEDANCYFEDAERYGLLERLEWYKDFLAEQLEVLEGGRTQHLEELRGDLTDVLEAQEAALRRHNRRASRSGGSTPRPRPRSRRDSRTDFPLSPTVSSSDYENWNRPPNPGAVPEAPVSPIFSDSSRTMSSSQTSYSNDLPFSSQPVGVTHWAQDVFDGNYPRTPYRRAHQSLEPCSCHGTPDPLAAQHLARDGFHLVHEMPFGHRSDFVVRLYWRPTDARARILITTPDSMHYCQPLTNLKVIRAGSTLQLCRARPGRRYIPWACLNFVVHERMVLFASTFIAMKRQDQHPIPHEDLIDELLPMDDNGEVEVFSGQISHRVQGRDMCHALRLFHDPASGTVRLEASPARGSTQDIPIWTAFVTRWAVDPDWAELNGKVVTLETIRPRPYVFLPRYEPPRSPTTGKYILPFTTVDDARYFMAEWTGLCRRIA